MKLWVAAFTQTGAALAERLAAAFTENGCPPPEICVFGKQGKTGTSLREFVKSAFYEGNGIIFVGACGIAVRAIAPFIRDKLTDPAVVAVDEQGRYAVSLLSGHIGGANKLAEQVAAVSGGVAVISTATDLSGVFAVDLWAAKHALTIGERELAKEVSAALLAGEPVGFRSDFPVEGILPEGLTEDAVELGIQVSLNQTELPFLRTLHLIPKIVTIGVGCKKGVSAEQFERTVRTVLAENHLSIAAVTQLATITLKEKEPCIRAFCSRYHLPLAVISGERLAAVEGDFTPSDFVKSVTGVDNVCERAAVCASEDGRLIVRKRAADGITVAGAVTEWSCIF